MPCLYLRISRPAKSWDSMTRGISPCGHLIEYLAEAWQHDQGMLHVIAYSDPAAKKRKIAGVLDDYAFSGIACLDAYEATGALSYFNFGRKIGDAMIEKFFDKTSGGFFDTAAVEEGAAPLGVLSARRKPFQDSPTPAGNSTAAILLLRLFQYTNDARYKEWAEQTLEVFAGMAEQAGLFAGTYGIAAVYFSYPHSQVVVLGNDELADRLYRAASASFALNRSILRLTAHDVVPQNLPPALTRNVAEPSWNSRGAFACRGMRRLPLSPTCE